MQANTLWGDLFTISDRNVFVRNDISLRSTGEIIFFLFLRLRHELSTSLTEQTCQFICLTRACLCHFEALKTTSDVIFVHQQVKVNVWAPG